MKTEIALDPFYVDGGNGKYYRIENGVLTIDIPPAFKPGRTYVREWGGSDWSQVIIQDEVLEFRLLHGAMNEYSSKRDWYDHPESKGVES